MANHRHMHDHPVHIYARVMRMRIRITSVSYKTSSSATHLSSFFFFLFLYFYHFLLTPFSKFTLISFNLLNIRRDILKIIQERGNKYHRSIDGTTSRSDYREISFLISQSLEFAFIIYNNFLARTTFFILYSYSILFYLSFFFFFFFFFFSFSLSLFLFPFPFCFFSTLSPFLFFTLIHMDTGHICLTYYYICYYFNYNFQGVYIIFNNRGNF